MPNALRTKLILMILGSVVLIATLLALFWSSPAPVAGQLCRTGQAPRLDAHGALMICQGGATWTPAAHPAR